MAALAMGIAVTAAAEGYQVNTLSTKQLGMGHTGVALKLGAESMLFNPAGMAFSDRTLDISASVSAVAPSSTATLPDGSEWDLRQRHRMARQLARRGAQPALHTARVHHPAHPQLASAARLEHRRRPYDDVGQRQSRQGPRERRVDGRHARRARRHGHGCFHGYPRRLPLRPSPPSASTWA